MDFHVTKQEKSLVWFPILIINLTFKKLLLLSFCVVSKKNIHNYQKKNYNALLLYPTIYL